MLDPTVTAAAGAALFAGAIGGAHCAGMCGGIAGAISLRTSEGALTAPLRQVGGAFVRNLAFNIGRITSYTVAGAVAGTVSSAALVINDAMVIRVLLFAMANLMLIALGLYLAGLWHGVEVLERGGAVVWRRIQPLAAGLLHSTSVQHTLMLGVLWGWIPCGLVYSILVTALASAGTVNGALIMFAFGLGTLPNLLAMGWAAGFAGKYLRVPAFRIAAGIAVAGFGALGLWRLPRVANLGGWAAIYGQAVEGVRAFFGA